MKSRCALKQADLVVRGVVEADAGTFTCQAGVHSQEMTLVVFSGEPWVTHTHTHTHQDPLELESRSQRTMDKILAMIEMSIYIKRREAQTISQFCGISRHIRF